MQHDSVDIPTLRAAFEQLMEICENAAGSKIVISDDYFWSVPPDRFHDVLADPPELTIGQLSESFEMLKVMVERNELFPYGLVWLADLLRGLGLSMSAGWE